MLLKITITALFVLSLAGATAEGLWESMPTVLVQFNGLLLLLSAICITTLALRPLIDGGRAIRLRSTPQSR